MKITITALACRSYGQLFPICWNRVAGLYYKSIFNLLEMATLFSKVALLFDIPTSNVCGLELLHILPTFGIVSLLILELCNGKFNESY